MLQRTFLLLILVSASLAGCADAGPVADEDAAAYDEFELQATDETGVIRGVVVDQTITPIMGATVQVEGTENSLTTGPDGVFGFKDLAPGFYNIIVDGLGYKETRTQTTVEAGVSEPPIVRILLEAAASELPSVVPLTFNGYIDCSITTPAYRVAVCSLPGVSAATDDNFLYTYEGQDLNASWIQAEMLWESTQPAGDAMTFTMEINSPADGSEIAPDAAGLSPLLTVATTEMLNNETNPYNGYIMHRVFNYEKPETTPPVPVCGIPSPINGGTLCLKGVGATLQQSFTIYTHVFSNGKPQDGWRFSGNEELEIQPL